MPPIMKLLSTFVLVTAAFVSGCSWGEDSGSSPPPGPDAPATQQPVCGDGVCASTELNTCASDCGQQPTCNGDGQCQPNETTASCPTDCGQQASCNNDGTCQANETNASCPNDCNDGSGSAGNCPADTQECYLCAIAGQGCPAGLDQDACTACLLGGGSGSGGFGDDSACTGGAPDGTCDATEEMALPPTCISDCPLF